MRIICYSKKYKDRTILQDIDLTFEKCGLIYVLGQSGTGKSTLLNIIGMLDHEFDGELVINGNPVIKSEKFMNRYRSEMIGFVFQEFNLVSSLSVKDNIMISLELSRTVFDQNDYDAVMKKLNILHIENRDVATLSGGEKQRVAIARAMVRGSRIILADEPTGNLDAMNSENIMLTLKEISKDRLVIIVSHSEYFAGKYGDRILHISKNIIISDEDKGYANNSTLDEFIEPGAKKLDLKSKRYLKLSWMNFLLRKDRIIPIIVSMTIAMLCLSVVLGILGGTGNLINDVNKSILELDKITVKNYSNKFFRTIDNSLIAEITGAVECSKVIPYYDTKINLSYNNKSLETKIEVIDSSDFFRDRFNIIEGRNITLANEILIDRTIAGSLFGDTNCIGKKVELKTDTGFAGECEITGIYDIVKSDNISTVYMTKELNADLSSGTLSSSFFLGYANEDIDKNIMFKVKTFSESNEIIIDNETNKSDSMHKVFVSASGFNYLISKIAPQYSLLPIEDINKAKIPAQIKNSIFGQIITMQKLDVIVFGKVQIAGVCTENEASDSLVFYLPEESVNSFNESQINTIILYLKDYSAQNRDRITKLFKQRNYTFEMASDKTGALVMVKMSVIGMILIVITLIVILLSCLMINFSVKINVRDRIYEAGVLKSLGATDRVIFKIFIFDNILLGFCVSAITFIILASANITHLTRMIMIDEVRIYQLNFWHVVSVMCAGCFICVLSGLKETIGISKLSIVAAIQRR